MSSDRGDLDALLTIVEDFADKTLIDRADVDLGLITSTPLATLVPDLLEADVPDALAWAFEVVEAVAQRSASFGFVLASRYAVQFAVPSGDGAADGFIVHGEQDSDTISVPAAPLAAGNLEQLVVITPKGVFRLDAAELDADQPGRSGLAGARLARVAGQAGERIDAIDASVTAWPILLGGVMCGLGAAQSRLSVRYTQEREQFGAPIASFPGLRAVVGTAYVEVRRARALLHSHALGTGSTPLEDVLSTVADAVVSSAIDTVQSMGGYGYTDEFPAAGMLRDAVSLRARTATAVRGWRAAAVDAYSTEGRVN